jgi:hypothetical protein
MTVNEVIAESILLCYKLTENAINAGKTTMKKLLLLFIFLLAVSAHAQSTKLVSNYASLNSAVAAIGNSNPTILKINRDTTLTKVLRVPANMLLDCTGGEVRKINGSITFAGFGLKDPLSKTPCFSGFKAGDITFSSSTEYPSSISTEVFSTGNASLSERVAIADAAFLSKPVKIVCYPRTITSSIKMSRYRSLHFAAGTYANSINTWNPPTDTNSAPFVFTSDFSVTADPLARLYTSSVAKNGYMFSPATLTGSLENVSFRGLHFIGSGAAGNGAASVIITGNAKRGGVFDCIFEGVRDYPVAVGGYGSAGNYAEDFTVSGNTLKDVATQNISVINGKNIKLIGNQFNLRGVSDRGSVAVIDIEPNQHTDYIENLLIDGNTFDLRGCKKFAKAIAIQGTNTVGVRRATVTNNTAIGLEISASSDVGVLQSFLFANGVEGLTVTKNTVQGAYSNVVQIYLSRNVTLKDNTFRQIAEIMLIAVADSNIDNNQLIETATPVPQSTSITESEQTYAVTSSGSTITLTTTRDAEPRVYAHFKGLAVRLNDSDYTITAVDTTALKQTLKTSAAVGTLTVKSISFNSVDTGADTITSNSHGFKNGARLKYTAGAGGIGGLSDGATYFVVGKTANTFQLSLTEGGSAINLFSQGMGTHTFTPVLITKFSSNAYRGNKASDGIKTEKTGKSVVY